MFNFSKAFIDNLTITTSRNYSACVILVLSDYVFIPMQLRNKSRAELIIKEQIK